MGVKFYEEIDEGCDLSRCEIAPTVSEAAYQMQWSPKWGSNVAYRLTRQNILAKDVLKPVLHW